MLLAPVLGLAACDSRDAVDAAPPGNGAHAVVKPVATPGPSPRPGDAEAATGGAMPDIFLGRWAAAAARCDGSANTMIVEPRQLIVGTRPAVLADIELQEPGVAKVTVAIPGVRGSETHVWTLHVAEDRTRLDRMEAGAADIAYFPCAAA